MSKEKQRLSEARALRYIELSGLNPMIEEVDIEELSEPVEGAAAGGENLVNPVDHAKVVSGESNVSSVEVENIESGEVEQVSEATIAEIAKNIKIKLYGKEN